MTLYYRPPQLPWSDRQDRRRFVPIVSVLLALVLVIGIAVPLIELPEPDRKTLEQLPPQLARVLERQKLEPPKPAPVEEVKPESRPEPPKPEPEPEPRPEPPKPQPRPEPRPKVEATEQQRTEARETARKAFGNEALSALRSMRSQLPVAELNTSSLGLSNAGNQATQVGSVVDRGAAARTSGGVDASTLTSTTVGEQLGERQLTAVAVTAEQQEAETASRTRSQEELRETFERYKGDYDRLYRMALRKNPALQGAATLSLKVEADGSVSSCSVLRSDLNDPALHKRLEMKCRQMTFGARRNVDMTVVEFPIRFMP